MNSRKRKNSSEDGGSQDKRVAIALSDLGSEEFLDDFKKDAIWREMMIYKEKLESSSLDIAKLEKTLASHEFNLTVVHQAWTQFESDIHEILRLIDTESNTDPSGPFLGLLIEPLKTAELKTNLKEIQLSCNKILTQIVKKLENGSEIGKNFQDAMAKYHSLTKEGQKLRDQLVLNEKQVVNLQTKLSEAQELLSHAQRKILRQQSEISKRVYVEQQETPKPAEEIKSQSSEMALDQRTDSVVSLSQPQQDNGALEEMAEKAKVNESLAEYRLQEYIRIDKEKRNIQDEYNRLFMDFQTLPEERLAKDCAAYVALKTKYDIVLSQKASKDTNLEELNLKVADLENSRRIFRESIIKEESERREVLEGEITKLTQDLTRVRSNRDSIQAKLEKTREKLKNFEETVDDLKKSFQFSKDRIKSLLDENRRLKMTLTGKYGNPEFYKDAFLACEYFDGVNGLPEMKGLHNSLKERLDKALGLLNQNGIEFVETSINGLKPKENVDSAFVEGETNSLVQKISDLTKSLEAAETQSSALSEIETISESFTKLEARQAEKDKILEKKENEIQSIASEKSHLQQKLNILQKEKDSVYNKNVALQKNHGKQAEHIKRLESEKRAKELLFIELEKKVSDLKELCYVHERKAEETLKMNEEVSKKLEAYDKKHVDKEDTIKSLQAKIHELEEDNKKLDIKIQSLQRRIPNDDGDDDSGDVGSLKKQIQDLKDWKRIAQCSVCEFRIKSHVLLKCMHVFCKECIDTRIETRQRKCPQCGLPFGLNEVKQIYI